ncbi:MAG: hypothetical protein JEZ10_01820 [Verrucomicrobia bacterium]|nr:hypothetical protein [Verrucomicrobiota bacterium]
MKRICQLSRVVRGLTFAIASSCVLFSLPQSGFASLIIDSDTSFWAPITYGVNLADPVLDQQTGGQDGDLVGDANHYAFYTQFDDAGTSDLTDGTIAFRARLNRAKNYSKMEFNQSLFVGIDANRDGALDLFVGVNNSPSGNGELAMWNPGTGANTGPSTTSIVSPPVISVVEALKANYDFSLVSATIDPSAINFDIDGEGNTDVFLSFSFDFRTIVDLLNAKGISLDQNTAINYVMATSTQDNALNMDLNGIDGGIGSTMTYDELGATSDTFSPTGDSVPEPAVMVLLATGVFSILIGKRLVPGRT